MVGASFWSLEDLAGRLQTWSLPSHGWMPKEGAVAVGRCRPLGPGTSWPPNHREGGLGELGEQAGEASVWEWIPMGRHGPEGLMKEWELFCPKKREVVGQTANRQERMHLF